MGMKQIEHTAVEEALILEDAGVDGLQVENIWDYPYVNGDHIGYETVAAIAAVTAKLKMAVKCPVGINCHINGGKAALAVAVATNASWIRVFEYVNAYVSHAGLTEGIGGMLARYRAFLRAPEVAFFCDVNVKHGSHFIISDRTIAEQAHDAESEGADALIVTGFETGKAPTPEKIKEFSRHIGIPVLIGSGLTAENVSALLPLVDGAIVGSNFKKDNQWKNPVDRQTSRRFMDEVRRVRKECGNIERF
jgi:membrane complex biogenesis BtpA family protein